MSFFFLLVLWLGICVEVDVDRITILPSPPRPSLPPYIYIYFFFRPYPQFSLKRKWQLFEISARLKLVSVPFSSLLLDISDL